MATTKKTTTTAKKPEAEKDTVKMEREIAELKEQIAELMAMKAEKDEAKTQTEEFPKRKTIKFINLSFGGLTLKGTRVYRIAKQFDSVQVPVSEALAIVSNMPNALASGIVYIDDRAFVEEIGFDDVYDKILDEKQLKNFLMKNVVDICETYKGLSEKQKGIVINMIKERVSNNLPVDANVLVELGKLSGVDFFNNKVEIDEEV